MAPSDQTLQDFNAPDESPEYLYIDDQNIIIQHFWSIFGCIAPLVLFWAGVLICGALAGW